MITAQPATPKFAYISPIFDTAVPEILARPFSECSMIALTGLSGFPFQNTLGINRINTYT